MLYFYSVTLSFILLQSLTNSYDFANISKAFLQDGNTKVSTKCQQQFLLYVESLAMQEMWALRMYDAGAKLPPSGILDGNLYSLGSFDECINLKYRKNNTDIVGKYCIGKILLDNFLTKSLPKSSEIEKINILLPNRKPILNVSNLVIHIAKCFPAGCSHEEMEAIYAWNHLDIVFNSESCQTKDDVPKFDTGSIATASVFAIILLVVIISTAYDVAFYYLNKHSYRVFLTSFSLLANGRSLLKTGGCSNEISCLHGIRVISTMLIVLGHLYGAYFHAPYVNSYLFNWTSSEANMFFISFHFAVDTFLLLSGLLVSYNFMLSTAKGIKFNILLHYVHRYIRLTPVLAIVVVFHMYLLIHVRSGPLIWQLRAYFIDSCKTNWWTTLLYIQTVFHSETGICVPHSWYLALDMQLFIISPFLLVPLKKWPKFTLLGIGLLAVLSMIACFLIGWFYRLDALLHGNSGNEKTMDYIRLYYMPFYTRAVPWLVGIILGYLISRKRRLRFLENKIIVFILWIISITVLCVCYFSGYGLVIGGQNKWGNSFYLTLVRPAWAIAICWIIFACSSGLGGPVNRFLSLSVFQVISKLTYTLYLVHYTIVYIIAFQIRVVPIFNHFEAMYSFWGCFACACFIATILTLTVEFPVITIDRILFNKRNSK